MEITRKKNRATRIVFPLVDSSSRPAYYTGSLTNPTVSGLSWQDEQAAASLSISDTPSQFGGLGLWELSLSQSEMNPDSGNDDYIALKVNADEVDEQTILVQLQTYDSKNMTDVVSDVVSSGNAANWSGVADVSSLASQSSIDTISGNINNLPTLTEIYSFDIDGKTSSGVLQELLSESQGKIVPSGDTWTYYAQDNVTPLFTLSESGVNRVRS